MRSVRVLDYLKFISISLFVLTLPFGNKFLFLCNNLSIFLFGFVWLFESTFSDKIQALRLSRVVVFYALYFILFVIGLLYSSHFSEGLFIIEKKLPLLLIPLFLVSMRPLSVRQSRIIAYLFVAACFVASIYCLWVAIVKNLNEGHNLNYVYNAIVNDIHLPGRYLYFNYWYFTNQLLANSVSMHPVYLAMYLLVAGIFLVKLEWQQRSKWRRVSMYLILLLFLLLIILLSSRTQLFCAGLAIIFGFVKFVLLTKQFLRAIILSLIGFALAAAVVFYNPIIRERIVNSNVPGTHYSQNKYGEGGLSLRTYKWKYTAETIKSNIVFGYGTGDGQIELEKTYNIHDFKIGVENHFNPHNQYLQTMLDLGILGFVILFLTICNLIFVSYRLKNEVMFMVTILISISFITESMLELNKGIVFFAFMPLFTASYFSSNKKHVEI